MDNLYLWISISAILGTVVIVLLMKIWLMKSSIKEIRQGMNEKLSEDTNTLIDISSRDKDIKLLVSDLNKQLKVLREERIRCQQGDKKLKDAVTNISHDLRTPLTAIRGYLDMLEKEDKTDAAQRYLKVISGRTEAINQLTDELLKYSVAVAENQALQLEEVILNNVLEESISEFYAVLRTKQIFPEIEICEEKICRKLNKSALSRIFSNIISNAVRYSGGDLKITLSEQGNITFSNTASQLDEVIVGQLFDRFYTVENAGKTTGLGLSIAKALTEAMGGQIYAEYYENILAIKLKF